MPTATASNPSLEKATAMEPRIGDTNGRPSISEPLLASDEPAPYRIVNQAGKAPIVLTCDHASCTIPRSLHHLGLTPQDVQRHIGWDIGAEPVTRRLSERFDAPAVLSTYSRLVIDCNRRIGSETSIPEVSDGTPIPGNTGISLAEANRRAEALFNPYHSAITQLLDGVRQSGRIPVYVAIHSFTVKLAEGARRPWHFGVLWDQDPRIAVPLIRALRQFPGILVGDNEPYSGRDHFDFSQEFHASSKGLPSALVEIREDLIRDATGAAKYADMLGSALDSALANVKLAAITS